MARIVTGNLLNVASNPAQKIYGVIGDAQSDLCPWATSPCQTAWIFIRICLMCVIRREVEQITNPTAGDNLFRMCKGGPRAADMPRGSFLVWIFKHGDAKCPALLNGKARRRLTKDMLARTQARKQLFCVKVVRCAQIKCVNFIIPQRFVK